RFDDIREIVSKRPGDPLLVEFERAGQAQKTTVTPRAVTLQDQRVIGQFGVRGRGLDPLRLDPFRAFVAAVEETWALTRITGVAIGQMIDGSRSTKDLRGPAGIAEMAGDMAQNGFYAFIWFLGVLSLQLCLINLLPVPMLDGGHLLFYGIEAVRRRPLGARAQEYGFRIGLALVLSLMVFVTWNDLVHLRVVEFIVNLVS
ncbi:MAG: RIP metalloprotease, partial [Alphaproteobacteria bacterium]